MGTHPIFESDFDCLTDMNRLICQTRRLSLLHSPHIFGSPSTIPERKPNPNRFRNPRFREWPCCPNIIAKSKTFKGRLNYDVDTGVGTISEVNAKLPEGHDEITVVRNSFDSELKFHPVQNQIVKFKLVEKALDDGGSKFIPFMISGEKGGRLKFTEERHFLNGVEIQGRRQGKLIDGKIYT